MRSTIPIAQATAATTPTARETEIMALICGGLSNKEIASALNISLPTVKSHVHSMLGTLVISSRLEVAAFLRASRRDAKGKPKTT